MPGAISQIQMLYNAEEDRILFRVNSTDQLEFRFWITRRFSGLLLKVLKQHREKDPDVMTQSTPEAKEALASFKQEKAMGQADFSQKFAEQDHQRPLGDEPRLAFKLNYAINDGNLQLGIHPKDGQGISLVLNQDLNATLTQLLLSAQKKAGWNLPEAQPLAVAATNRVIN
ncbi:MAG: hypothetical protein O2780_01305 [Proteobacteria bacterium]|nr:hypothetical protein [Pseudomonadota bacterium]MDA1302386.1 hypothetical protein [Pseudomonadota bacterium]